MSQDTTAPMIEVEHLRKSYGDRTAVADVSLSVAEGEIFGILGPNGAGKTTTVECVAGLRVGDGGQVRVAGLDPWTDRLAVNRVLGIQLQDSQLQPKITVQEALELWSALYDDPVPWHELADRLGLVDKLTDRFAALSGGQQQRLAIALALVGRPRAVVLDELTTGLDPRVRRETWELVRDVRAGGTTVVLVTHQMEEAQQLCDRIAVIDRGRVCALDTPQGLVGAVAEPTRISFRPSQPLDLAALGALPGVSGVRREDDRVVVLGTSGAVAEVLRWTFAQGASPDDLQVVDGTTRTLEDAYLELTDQTIEKETS